MTRSGAYLNSPLILKTYVQTNLLQLSLVGLVSSWSLTATHAQRRLRRIFKVSISLENRRRCYGFWEEVFELNLLATFQCKKKKAPMDVYLNILELSQAPASIPGEPIDIMTFAKKFSCFKRRVVVCVALSLAKSIKVVEMFLPFDIMEDIENLNVDHFSQLLD
ncbi:hypothetical protein V8G54_036803 [Vigna mungo]|uniref:Uncharacterized protein n=1 Tax=Vigna mungo TaxID=3915 RepID=A0AAQ3MJ48_VIGMU